MALATAHSSAGGTPWLTYISLGVSALALVSSGVTLWRSYFAPMRVLVACGPLTFRVTPFRSAKERWFVADAKIDLTFTNSGARPGIVYSLRLRADYPRLLVPKAHEFFRLNSEVDPREYDKYADDRLEWSEKANIGHGEPFILLPKESQTKRLIFTVRWNEPVIAKDITFVLEVHSEQSGSSKDYGSWKLSIDESIWTHMANEKGSYTIFAESQPHAIAKLLLPNQKTCMSTLKPSLNCQKLQTGQRQVTWITLK
jgi:hypothetical protein